MKEFTTLVAIDFSKSSFIVLAKALDFTQKMGGELHVVHIVESSIFSPKKDLVSITQSSFKKLRESFKTIEEKNFHCLAGRVKDEVSKVAKILNADMIIIGKNGESHMLEELFIGSHTKDIVKTSHMPVLVVKHDHELKYENILIPTDLSEKSAQTIKKVFAMFPTSNIKIANFFYLPFENRLNTYGFNEEDVVEYEASLTQKSEERMRTFVESLHLPKEAKLTSVVRKSSLNSKLFESECEDIGYDLLVMHTSGEMSFYSFDVLEDTKADTIIMKA